MPRQIGTHGKTGSMGAPTRVVAPPKTSVERDNPAPMTPRPAPGKMPIPDRKGDPNYPLKYERMPAPKVNPPKYPEYPQPGKGPQPPTSKSEPWKGNPGVPFPTPDSSKK